MVVKIARILCPIDLSEFSRQALDYTVTLGRWYDAAVTILHVAGEENAALAGSLVPARSPALVSDEVHAFCAPWTSRSANVEIVLSRGNPVKEIVSLADSLQVDLLVMGSHGRSGFERLWLGSVTEKVLRKVSCPVLTVPPHARPPATEIVFKTIVCPVDFSDASLRALEYALSLAEESLARLILLHVVEALAETGFKDGSAAFAVPEYHRLVTADASARLAALVPETVRAWCQVEEHIVTGKPHREILRFATESGAELIAMGVHGRGAIDLTLFGSTTHQVVRAAKCPVLTLRTPVLG